MSVIKNKKPLFLLLIIQVALKLKYPLIRCLFYPMMLYQRKYILDTIAECCEVMPLKKNTVFPTIFKKIVTIKEGLLKKQHAAEMEDAWVLEKKPLIKIIL